LEQLRLQTLERQVNDLRGSDLSGISRGSSVFDRYGEYLVVNIELSFGRTRFAVVSIAGKFQSDVGLCRSVDHLREQLAKEGYRSTKPASYEGRKQQGLYNLMYF
jgi:hypothetical protein